MRRIVGFFVWIDRVFARVLEILLIALLLGMVGLVGGQVILRNFFSSGIAWADVASRHMVLWVTFLGAMLATRSRGHLAIDVLMRAIPRVARNSVRIALDALACGVTLLLTKASLDFVLQERLAGSVLFLDIPTWIFQVIIPFGFAMISLEYAIGIALDIYRIATNTSASGHVAGRGRA